MHNFGTPVGSIKVVLYVLARNTSSIDTLNRKGLNSFRKVF